MLSGGQDRATPAELGLEIASLIPAAEHLLVPDAGHSIPVEQPQALLAAITGR
ncbi:alpha/beta fold hydrolase [Gibbsiella quercinecans]|uniref:alpha/beta fold hydrolase n=1 Tax=Gibbsiella quercinecans TaxID=929813 RepID=UPI003C6D444B